MFHVYMLYSPALDRHYIGQTGDLEGRIRFHVAKATAYTAQTDDWELVFLERVATRGEAMTLERRIKRAKSTRAISRYMNDPRNLIQKPIHLTAADNILSVRPG